MLSLRAHRALPAVAASLVLSMVLAACSSPGAPPVVGGGGAGGAVLLTGAGGVPGLATGPDDALIAAVRGNDPAHSLSSSIELLADAGIAVFADTSASTPVRAVQGTVSPIRLTRSQVLAMTYDVRNGAAQGISGGEIDSSSPMPQGAPALTFVLAAWITHADTRGAALARALMGPQPWTEAPRLTYPQLVLTLFSSDMTLDAATQTQGAAPLPGVPAPPPGAPVESPTTTNQPVPPGSASSSSASASSTGTDTSSATTDTGTTAQAAEPAVRLLSASAPLAVAAAGDACGAVSNFIDNTLDSIANKLHVDPANLSGSGVAATAGRVLAGIWNFAVDLARSALGAVINALTQPVVGAIRAAVGVISVIVEVVSMVTNPAHTLTGDGGESFAVDPAPDNHGVVTLSLDPALPWDYPPFVSGCAAASGVQLPNLSGEGTTVDWIVDDQNGLVSVQKPGRSAAGYTGVLEKSGTDRKLQARLEFVTGRESSNDRASGDEVTDTVKVTAQWGNAPANRLLAFAESLLSRNFTGVVGQVVNPIIHTALSGVLSKLRAFTGLASADLTVAVMHSKHVVCKR